MMSRARRLWHLRCVVAALLPFLAGPSMAADDAGADAGLLSLGQSLGGHWRQTPSTDGDLMGSLPNGRVIQILEDTGESFNGFNWFKIRVGEDWGYQWGGIMCSNREKLPNIFAVCDPKNRLELGAAALGLNALNGNYTIVSKDDSGASAACGPRSQVVLGQLNIEDPQLNFHDRACTVDRIEPKELGLHLRGDCVRNQDTDPGQTPINVHFRSLDVLALNAEDRTLALLTLSGPDKGMLSVYAHCSQ